MSEPTLKTFDEITRAAEDGIDLGRAALLIASEEYPDLEINGYLERLDSLADSVHRRLPEQAGATQILGVLNEVLFEENGFSGNLDDYYDPRNSFLNEVLDRRVGIPITLSILYIEIGRRLGLDLEGVSFPGHFLVKFELGDGIVVIDPFYGGRSLSEEELEERIEDLFGTEVVAHTALDELLIGASKKQILVRMLRNLKGVYAGRDQWEKALSASHRILQLDPEQSMELRDRGRIYEHLECPAGAMRDFQRYIELEPEAGDHEEVRERVIQLHQRVGRLN